MIHPHLIMKRGINVLSLFDGMSGARVALKKAGIPVKVYYSSEIDKYALQVANKNYPEDERYRLGDITKTHFQEYANSEWPIDLLIGGSPCQDLSSSNVWTEQRGIEGKKSSLFWEYVRVLKEVKPRYFLLENVGSCRKEDRDIISRELGRQPIRLNSKLFLPQNRNRLYWTNIPFSVPVKPRHDLTMQNLLEVDVDEKYHLSEKMRDCVMRPAKKGWVSGKMETDLPIARPLTATMAKMHRADTDNYITTNRTPQNKTNLRRLTPIECERLQGFEDNYTQGVSDTQRYRMLGNGFTTDAIAHILKGIRRNDW